ncbi:hypothetical protein QN277_004353 [Acacia crassicarpa]|uniref:Retrotransposon Copia-like N-terminal domain-containing protein n=1 Tax=Acacia crassicarpa TaxID=499986 RepID=A0AAE1MIA7_9FABA|nr:hypothetical protein QN277_004353 [Acacia crassicarpa]
MATEQPPLSSSTTRASTSVSSPDLSDLFQNVGNPYYLHPNENPSLVLVSPVLSGPNYHSWARAMKMALVSKNKTQFLDSYFSIPSLADPVYPAWECCNMMVLSWLTRLMSPTLAQSILWIDKASDVWDDLRARFSEQEVFRLADLQEEIQTLKQGDLSVSDYFTKLKILWDEFLVLRPLLSCTCNPCCKCGVAETYRQHIEQDYVIRFLKGLSDRFSAVKSQIMLIHPLPNINRVFSLVTQQERELGFSTSAITALFNKTVVSRPPSVGDSKPPFTNTGKQCSYCGKPRHTEATCYRKHGFPPSFKFRNASVNAASVVDSVSAPVFDGKPLLAPDTVVNPAYSFTPDQYRKLLALVQADKSSPLPSASVTQVSANDFTLSHSPPTFKEDDWFS